MSMVDHKTNKAAAVDFLQLVVEGNIDQAYEKYVDMAGKHHNAFFPAGFQALKKAMAEAHLQFPNKVFQTKHVLGDNDMVAVHSHMALKPGEMELGTLHLFRFRDGKIVEMWDLGQQVPAQGVNQDGMF